VTNMERKDATSMKGTASRPLGVDLDGTLIRTDLLVESVFALLKRNALFVFLLPLWLLKGFLAYLKQEHADGRRLILDRCQ